jgi:hypothetical protein
MLAKAPAILRGSDLRRGVAALGTNNVWAVGAFNATGGNQQTLFLRWNGTAWVQVAGGQRYVTGVATLTLNEHFTCEGGGTPTPTPLRRLHQLRHQRPQQHRQPLQRRARSRSAPWAIRCVELTRSIYPGAGRLRARSTSTAMELSG